MESMKSLKQIYEQQKKPLESITKNDVIDCLKDEIPKGWKIYKVYTETGKRGLKIRAPYSKTEIHFNEDGYKYDRIFLKPNLTKHYKFLSSKGYDV